MWEQRLSTAHGGFSVRSIFTYALAVLVAAFLWVIAVPNNTFAADAEWNGSSITYENNVYVGPASEQTVEALGLPKGTTVYTYVEPTGTTNRKIHILYYAPGVDPGTADGVNYRTHPYNGPNNFGSASAATAVTIEPQTDNVGTSSCVVEGGLGWIICPVTNTLAGFMDWVFNILVGFLNVRPIETAQENAMYRAWAFMRTFANVAFVIAFLIIIYSQLTSVGVSNYGIKKLLPRIIIAAILVNISYIICAIAIDVSNVLGHSIQNLFIQMRNTLVGTEGNSWDIISWESMASFVLSGGTLITAGSIAAFSGIATYGVIGAVALLLPALVTLLVAVLVALIVMAARQALITILTILAPLAFVAYLLPNTEKWFDKWRGIFMTMLILFPAFSIIFGGSQLAGIVIIQNADSINLIILGMIVQVAPLFITPFLIKFSGSLLGRIAGMVNNPNKGMIDRTRNFAKDRAENMKARRLGTPARRGVAGMAQRAGQRIDHNRRRREGWRNAHTAMADANWANSRDFSDVDQRSREAADRKTLGETNSALRYDRAKVTNAELRQLDVDVRQVKLNLENAQLNADIQNWERNHTVPVTESKLQQRVLKDIQSSLHKEHDADYDEIRQGSIPAHMPTTPHVVNYTRLAQDALQANKVATDRQNSAVTQQTIDYGQLIKNNESIARTAGGIRGEEGYLSVMANASKVASKYTMDDISNIKDTMDYDLATDTGRLLTAFKQSTTMAQRVAYAQKMAENGAPGIETLRQAFDHYEQQNGGNRADLNDFKEFVATERSIMSAGKDLEFWLVNTVQDGDTQPSSFKAIRENTRTWTNMTANAFAAQNAATHKVALELLYNQDPEGYNGVIDMIRNNPGALAQVKQQVRERFAIYSDAEIEEATKKGRSLRNPGELKSDDPMRRRGPARPAGPTGTGGGTGGTGTPGPTTGP